MIDVALALDSLVPQAEYFGSLTENTEQAYNDLAWNDSREKPSWSAINSKWDELVVELAWTQVRNQRVLLMDRALMILDRHRNQKDFGLPTTIEDTQAFEWSLYLQDLRDLTEQHDPENLIWPTPPEE